VIDAPRLLDPVPPTDLDGYVRAGGGRGVEAARNLAPPDIVDLVAVAGLRGRGGAGFPTGTKWETVALYESELPTTVVVNAAEGEPGSFKDRAILRANPYRVLEGALIAARAVDAPRVVVATKASFTAEIARLEEAIAAVRAAAWAPDVAIELVRGPSEYLFGEETALLEVIAGRPPFPRLAPPYRRGATDVGDDPAFSAGADLASPGGDVPPALANNVETLANVPGILADGPEWFRAEGTGTSPGTAVVTVTGSTRRHGVAEVALGTPLADVIDQVGGGARRGRELVGVLSGVANPILPAGQFATPLGYDEFREAGSGLGATGFIVFDDGDDLVAVAHGVTRFLSVESCGQCRPCKQDGIESAALLERIRRSDATERDLAHLEDCLLTVTDGARCFLAQQTQQVAGSILQHCPDVVRAHLDGSREAAPAHLIAPIVDLVDGVAVLDESQWTKQPDWTHDETDSGQAPAERYGVSA
jgi:NADH:ubiquinone oxidoreductase subunit F (NADH-binding)